MSARSGLGAVGLAARAHDVEIVENRELVELIGRSPAAVRRFDLPPSSISSPVIRMPMMSPGRLSRGSIALQIDRESHAGGELASVLVGAAVHRGESRTGRRGGGARHHFTSVETLPASAGTRRRRKARTLSAIVFRSSSVRRLPVVRFAHRRRTEERTEVVGLRCDPVGPLWVIWATQGTPCSCMASAKVDR